MHRHVAGCPSIWDDFRWPHLNWKQNIVSYSWKLRNGEHHGVSKHVFTPTHPKLKDELRNQ